MNNNRVNVHFSGDKEGVEIISKFFGFKKRNILLIYPIQIVKEEASADYVIRAKRNKFLWLFKGDLTYSLTYPFKNEPLIRSLLYVNEETLRFIGKTIFYQLIEWTLLSKLQNENTQLNMVQKPCEIKIYKAVNENNPSKDILLIPKNGCVYIENLSNIRVAVTNNTENQTFNARLFYLSNTFEVILLEENELYLSAKDTYWLQERESIPYELDDYIQELNLEEAFFEFKLVYSTECLEEFYPWDLEGLEPPHKTPSSEVWFNRTAFRQKMPKTSDWNTDKIRVFVKNPNYKAK